MGKIVFRVDSSYKIGTGHLIRCISLARLLNAEVHFVTRNLPGNASHLIRLNQFVLHEIDSFDVGLGEQLIEDEMVGRFFALIKPDVIVVDHYGLDQSWEKMALGYSKEILVIDDLDRVHSPSVSLLDQNYKKDVCENYKNIKNRLFLGPEFALLSENFLNFTGSRSVKEVKNIMVYFGGSDLHEQTRRVYRLIHELPMQIHWNFVVSENSKDIEFFRELNCPNSSVYINIDYMARLMSECDLFIGAGGATSWERAKLGLPTVCISLAENQNINGHELAGLGVHYFMGYYNTFTDNQLKFILLDHITAPEKLNIFRENSKKLNVSSRIDELVCYLNGII